MVLRPAPAGEVGVDRVEWGHQSPAEKALEASTTDRIHSKRWGLRPDDQRLVAASDALPANTTVRGRDLHAQQSC